MVYLKDVYLEELSEGKYYIESSYFSKILPKPACKKELHTNVIGIALNYKKNIIDDAANKEMLESRFTKEEYNYIRDLLVTGFDIDTEFYHFTLPWWYTIWCVWTNEAGEFKSV